MSGKLRVATVITRMAGGAGGVALRGAVALDPQEYEVTLLAGTAERDLLVQAEATGLQVIRVPPLAPRIDVRRDAAALRALTTLLAEGEYDVVHTHTAKAGALGRLAASRLGVPRIVHTFHGFPFHEFQPLWRRGLYVGVERWLARRTDMFIAVGSAVAAEAVRRRIAQPDRITTIPPAVDAVERPLDASARDLARRRIGLPSTARIVGTVARLDYQKAPEQWIDALAEVAADDVWGVWIGDGPLRERLLARVRSRGLTERFRHLGHRQDVAELLPALDVFALASRYEGLPCALIEAMSAGVPVVATAVNAVSDVVAPGVTGLLAPPGAPRLLGRAIRHLLDHPAEARRMATAARAAVHDRFTSSTLGAALDQTYRGCPSDCRIGQNLHNQKYRL